MNHVGKFLSLHKLAVLNDLLHR